MKIIITIIVVKNRDKCAVKSKKSTKWFYWPLLKLYIGVDNQAVESSQCSLIYLFLKYIYMFTMAEIIFWTCSSECIILNMYYLKVSIHFTIHFTNNDICVNLLS